jgi:hypothetical protein
VAYRHPGDVPDEPPDREAAAIQELGRRAGRVRSSVIVPMLLTGIAMGALLYDVLAELQYAWRGAHIPWVTGMMSFAPTFGAVLKVAPRVADAVVRRRLPRWRKSLAEEHGLDLAQLEETTRLLE